MFKDFQVKTISKGVSGACKFIKKETLAQAFSCEFCKISKNTFFIEHLRWLLLKVNNGLSFHRYFV